MLLEEGFKVFSSDASDKMLKYALKERWIRRKEPAFDNWGASHLSFYESENKTDGTVVFLFNAVSENSGRFFFLQPMMQQHQHCMRG